MAGAYRFFDARLLAIPARSNRAPYLMVISPMVLQDYLHTLELFGLPVDKDLQRIALQVPDKPWVINSNYNRAQIEDLEKQAVYNESLQGLSKLVGNIGVLLHDSDF